MESVAGMVKGTPLPVLLTAAFILYRFGIAVYRLCLHPLAKFPGPKIAAVTSLYEAYHEILLNGQYSKKISELHDIYGEYTQYLRICAAMRDVNLSHEDLMRKSSS